MRGRYFFLLAIAFFPACVENPYVQGERLYGIHCANCHLDEGQGLASMNPPLNDVSFREEYASQFGCIVRYGLDDTLQIGIRTFDIPMPGNKELTAAEIANIYNYIVHSWHPEMAKTSESEMQEQLKSCTIE